MHIPLNQCENVPFYTFVRGNFANRKIVNREGQIHYFRFYK